MELTANQRPFLYFPLGHHFEQTIHVRHRLGRYRAGRCMDDETSGPAEIAAAIATEIGREVAYRPAAPPAPPRFSPSFSSRPRAPEPGYVRLRAGTCGPGRVCTAARRVLLAKTSQVLLAEDEPGSAGGG